MESPNLFGLKSGVDISGATATANDVVQGKTFFGKDGAATGVVPKYTSGNAEGTTLSRNGTIVYFKPGFWGDYGRPSSNPYVEFYSGSASAIHVMAGATFTSNAGVNIEGIRQTMGENPEFINVGYSAQEELLYLYPTGSGGHWGFDGTPRIRRETIARELPILELRSSGAFWLSNPNLSSSIGNVQNRSGPVLIRIRSISYSNQVYDPNTLSITLDLSIAVEIDIGGYVISANVYVPRVRMETGM